MRSDHQAGKRRTTKGLRIAHQHRHCQRRAGARSVLAGGRDPSFSSQLPSLGRIRCRSFRASREREPPFRSARNAYRGPKPDARTSSFGPEWLRAFGVHVVLRSQTLARFGLRLCLPSEVQMCGDAFYNASGHDGALPRGSHSWGIQHNSFFAFVFALLAWSLLAHESSKPKKPWPDVTEKKTFTPRRSWLVALLQLARLYLHSFCKFPLVGF
jgi:hypothetical protein